MNVQRSTSNVQRPIKISRSLASILLASLALALIGCASPSHPEPLAEPTATTAPSALQNHRLPPRSSKPAYWYRQPAVASVDSGDYDKLWDACNRVAHEDGFKIDSTDYREGVMTTEPMVSKQFFEFWRPDAGTSWDTAEDSLQTIRRTIHFTLAREPDGRYEMTPKVLVERYAQANRRITSVSQFRSALYSPDATTGSPETDQGIKLSNSYWYAIGRDEEMEKQLAARVREQLGQH